MILSINKASPTMQKNCIDERGRVESNCHSTQSVGINSKIRFQYLMQMLPQPIQHRMMPLQRIRGLQDVVIFVREDQ
jgi:hypothetical protein